MVGGGLSVTERSYGPAPISKAESPVGVGVLSYMGYIGISSCEGYSFQAVYSGIGYLNQRECGSRTGYHFPGN